MNSGNGRIVNGFVRAESLNLSGVAANQLLTTGSA
jgi:hypothetical protein